MANRRARSMHQLGRAEGERRKAQGLCHFQSNFACRRQTEASGGDKDRSAVARSSAHPLQSSASALESRSGKRATAFARFSSSSRSAMSWAAAAMEAMTLLVAAMETSGPAPIGKMNSAACATGDSASLMRAIVSAPEERASAVAAMRSGYGPIARRL